MPIKKSYHTVIIGGGPAGLAATISSPHDTLLLEKNRITGKKLLLTGQGQCNFTNNLSHKEFIKQCGEFGVFLKRAYYNMDNKMLVKLLEDNGCSSFARADGKVFPKSLQSVTVRDSLLNIAQNKGVEIAVRYVVKDLAKTEKGFVVDMMDLALPDVPKTAVYCEKLIITTGGCSYPQTGSDGSGYHFAYRFGHNIIKPQAAIASVEIADYADFVSCSGNALQDISLVFYTEKGKFSSKGDLLLTHTGLSGPVILNNSYRLSAGDKIRVVLLENAENKVKELISTYPKRAIKSTLKNSPLSQALIDAILKHLKIDEMKQSAQLNRSEINRIIGFLSGAEFTISKVQELDYAMATAGGVDIKEINPATMESKIVKNLFFAGEILSYSLPTGGFNVQMAIATGWTAGMIHQA